MEAEYESMANSPRLQRLIAWEPYRAYIHGNRAYRLLLESSLGVLKVTKERLLYCRIIKEQYQIFIQIPNRVTLAYAVH